MNLDSLNKEQKEAVMTTEGPLLVLAGAGSGKTRVLTTRIVYLLQEKKIDPSNILAITFTNKAAREMKERVVNMIGNIAYQIQISTFHSFGLSIIRKHYQQLGLNKNFTIIDNDDSLIVIKNIMKELGIEENVKLVKGTISSNKNALVDSDEYAKYVNTEYDKNVYEIYQRYTQRLKQNNSLDFDDLLMMPIKILKENPPILKKYQEQYKYILIDEYQDTNEAQYLLAKMIANKYNNICVVGDDSQSIYSWRGSNYKNILNFEKEYPNCKIILLEQNYRSTKTIINASNHLIKNNKHGKEKNLWTENESGSKIDYNTLPNEKEEAQLVVKEIENLIASEVNYSEIAILYRTNAQSRNFEDKLLLSNIPYNLVGSRSFYDRKEIKDLMAYLKLIYNQYDDLSLTRIINVPKRKIGKTTLENLRQKATEQQIPLFEAIDSGKEFEFKKLIEKLIKAKDELTLTELVETILIESGLRKEIEGNSIENEIRLENLEEFKSITFQFEEKYGIINLEDFLAEISLVADIKEYQNSTDAITLMTIHNAKGLEFNYVFVVGLEESIFPHFNALSDEEQIDEERRLCYVAITRAKKRLWLSNVEIRTLYGNKVKNKPSRFVKEIDPEYLNQNNKSAIEDMVNSDIDYKSGDHIVFEPYGEGVIIAVKDRVLTVAFNQRYGIKLLIKGHKKIRKV